MQRFLMLVGVAVVAAAMYVAAGTASQQAKGPTAKQFKALKKQVATLSKELKTQIKPEADFSASYLLSCLITVNSDNTLSVNLVPAEVTTTGNPVIYETTSPTDFLQEINPSCLSPSALRHAALRPHVSGVRLWMATRTR
jgi:outer membrane murein-binding lipoprotein Lpp